MDFNIFSFIESCFTLYMSAMWSSPLAFPLPFMVSFLMFCAWGRKNGEEIETWGGEEWTVSMFATALFPIMYFFWFKEFVYPHLVKERKPNAPKNVEL